MFSWCLSFTYFVFFLNLCFAEIIFQEKLILTKNSDPEILRTELFADEPKLSSIDWA